MTSASPKTSSADSQRTELLRQLSELLGGGNAHATLEHSLEELSRALRGRVQDGLPYSIWQLVEHIRIAQKDILDFSRNGDGKGGAYSPLKWPDEYWPKEAAPSSDAVWDKALLEIDSDAAEFEKLLGDPKHDLYAPFPWGDGQNLLRQALLLADHTAYHTGEIVTVRRLLGAWPPK